VRAETGLPNCCCLISTGWGKRLSAGDLFRLLDDAGLTPTPQAVADIVWLAQFARPHADAGTGSADHVPEEAPVAADGGYPQAGQRVRPIRTPPVSTMSGSQKLMRPLLPMRRVPNRLQPILDENATADSAAHSGIVVPELRASAERGLSLTVVVDTGPAMSVWDRLEDDLLTLFRRLGAFRDVRKWYLRTAEDAVLGVSRTRLGDGPDLSAADRSAALRDIAELANPPGRRVILLLSDATSPAWHSGTITPVLRRWAAAGPLAIVQPLPRQLWDRTGLSPVQGRLSSRFPAAPNTRLRFRAHRRAFSGANDDAARQRAQMSAPALVPVPVLGLGPDWLGPWARFIASPYGGQLDCTVTLAASTRQAWSPPPSAAATAKQRVQHFVEQARPGALQLAIYLTAAPLTLPVMRRIQAGLLPETDPSHLAEVLLSGLLYTSDAAHNPDAPEAWRYDFAAGVREILLAGLSRSQALRVMSLFGEPPKLSAGESDADAIPATGAGISVNLPELVTPFAEISRQVLDRVDGRLDAEPVPREQPMLESTSPLGHASALIRRYQRTGQITDLDAAIAVLHGHPSLDPQPGTGQPIDQEPQHIAELALALRLRYSATGQRMDLDEAADIANGAIANLSAGSERAGLAHELSMAIAMRYALTGALADLDSAIDAASTAAADASEANEDMATLARHTAALGALLLRRAQRLPSPAYVDEAIRWLRAATAEPTPDTQQRAKALTDLACALQLRAADTAGALATADLNAGIDSMRAALELTAENRAEHSARLNGLAATLALRSAITGSVSDLREAVNVYQRAAGSIMARVADHAESLAGLGTALCEVARGGESHVLTEAIRSLRAAVSQTNEDDPARPHRLAALAKALLLRFELNQNRSELTEAAYFLGLAVKSASPDTAEQARYLHELGLTYERRYDLASMSQDLVLATDALRQASAIAAAENLTGIQTAFARILRARQRRVEAEAT
jgi:hypothetical protein